MEKIDAWILKEKEKINQKMMLEQLALEISKKFNIQKKEVLSLIRNNTLEWLSDLKDEIKEKGSDNLNNLDNKDLERLFLILKWAQEIIEKSSKIEIKILKDDIEKTINIDEFKNQLENYLPKKLIDRAKDPKYIHEHILWFSLWTANSIISIIDALYQIWAWIIKIPYHMYLVISWKWEFKSWKDI